MKQRQDEALAAAAADSAKAIGTTIASATKGISERETYTAALVVERVLRALLEAQDPVNDERADQLLKLGINTYCKAEASADAVIPKDPDVLFPLLIAELGDRLDPISGKLPALVEQFEGLLDPEKIVAAFLTRNQTTDGLLNQTTYGLLSVNKGSAVLMVDPYGLHSQGNMVIKSFASSDSLLAYLKSENSEEWRLYPFETPDEVRASHD
jgi:hypothetical protein